MRTILSRRLDQLAFGALLILAVGLYFEVWRLGFSIGNWSFSNVDTLQFVVIAAWAGSRLLNRERKSRFRRPGPLAASVGVWLVVVLISTLAAPKNQPLAFIFDARLLRGVLIAWAAVDVLRSRARWRAVFGAFVAGAVVVYLLGAAEAASVVPIMNLLTSLRGVTSRVGDLIRIQSSLSYPTIYAMMIELSLPCVLIAAMLARHWWLKIMLGVGLLAGIVSLIFTFTRGGLIGLALSLIMMLVVAAYRQRSRQTVRAVGSVMLLAVLVLAVVALTNTSARLRLMSENSLTWYRATYIAPESLSARPGELLNATVTVANQGIQTWRSQGERAYVLGYHILQPVPASRYYPATVQGLSFEGRRSALSAEVSPDEQITVQAKIAVPLEPGEYIIQWDMEESGVTWFSTHGSPTAETRLTVAGEPVANPEPISNTPFPPTIAPPVFGRLALWQVALKMVQDRPLLGVGPDNFRWRFGDYAGLATWDTNIHTNNLYIEWLADTGILGILAFLWFSVQMARQAWRTLPNPQNWPWIVALIGALVAWYAHGVVDYFFEFTPAYTAFWLLIGLLVALPRSQEMVLSQPPST